MALKKDEEELQLYTDPAAEPSEAAQPAGQAAAGGNSALLNSITSSADAAAALDQLRYEKSDAVLAAEQALADYTAQKPAAYESSYQQKIDALLDEILAQGAFQYSFDADPLYQQYKDQYARSAQLALQNSMANAAAATGGYGSSYAASAGSQAYQEQIAALNDVLPELYDAALTRWNTESSARRGRLEDLTALEKNAQAAYEAQMDDYYTGLKAYTEAAENAYSKDYEAYTDLRGSLVDLRDYYAAQEQQSIQNAQKQAEYELALKKYEESVRQWEAEQAAAQAKLAWEQAQYQQQQAAKQAQAAKSSKASSSGSGSSQPAAGSTLSTAAVQVQQALTQRAAALASRVGTQALTAAQRTSQIAAMLRSYYQAGTITKAEANKIGAQWGVSV